MAKNLDQIRAEQRHTEQRQTKKNSRTNTSTNTSASTSSTTAQRQSGQSDGSGGRSDEHQELTTGQVLLSWLKTLGGAVVLVMLLNGALVASFVVPTGSMENTVMTGDFVWVNKFVYGPSTPQMIPLVNTPLPYYRFPGFWKPERGDVIVFVYPGDRDDVKAKEFQYYLKRCVAVGGDTLEIRDKQLYVNGLRSELPPNGFLARPPEPRGGADAERTFPQGLQYSHDNYGPLRVPRKGDVVALSPQNFDQWRVFVQREGHSCTTEAGAILIDGKSATTYTVERDYCFGMGDNRDNSEDSRYWGFVPVENVVGTPMMVYWSWDTNLVGDSFWSTFAAKCKTIRFSRFGTVIR
jgi:signal peptidase I